MSEPRDRDQIDAWLTRDVEPLSPPPGTFERVSRRARRRKTTRAIVAGAGAVVVAGGAAAVPHLASAILHGGRPGRAVAAASAATTTVPAPTPAATVRQRPGATASRSATLIPAPSSSLSATTSGHRVPDHFQPTSITMISGSIGAVIGQAGTPGHCATRYCTSLAGTSDHGGSWYGVSAPLTGPPRGSTGVSQLRFLELRDGWAFGPQLYTTRSGGATWTREDTGGLRVTDLETAGNRAFALMASCRGHGGSYAADCTSFSLFTSIAGSTTWSPVGGPVSNLPAVQAGGQPASASLVLASGPPSDVKAGTGYLLAPSGAILRGPLTGAPWTVGGSIPAPCRPGPALASGQPAGVQLASGSSAASVPQLVLVCDGAATAGSSQAKASYVSADGAHWQQTGTPPAAGTAASLAAASGGLVVLATTAGIDFSANSGASWRPAAIAAAPAGGFAYVGMTTADRGVAVPADPALGEIFTTTDGGRTWKAAPVQGSG